MRKKKTVKRRSTTVLSRNAGTMTEAQYFQKIRSALRNAFKYWKPMSICLENASRPYKGKNKLQKKEYQCNECKNWFKRTLVQTDHVVECGSLNTLDDIKGFIERLTIEDINGYQILCKPCHKVKTLKFKNKGL